MDVVTIFILVSACTIASFVQRVSGFGFGIFIMTILPYVTPSYGEATTLSGMLSAAQSFFVVIHLLRYVSWRRQLPILLVFLVVSYFAVQYVASVEGSNFKRIFGAMLIAMSLYFFFLSERITVRPTLPIQTSMGALSGVMGGLFAMQGPPAVLYFAASERQKECYLAMTQVYFFVGNVFMTFYRASSGLLTDVVWQSFVVAFVGIFVGSWFGKKIFDRISARLLRKIIYAYMAFSGVVALFS